MKSKIPTILFCLLFRFGFGQAPCLPTAGGIPAGDDPPGCHLCGPIYVGSTEGYSPGTIDFEFPCGTIENSQWINVIADPSGVIRASILSSNCKLEKGVEMAIYDQNINLISTCFSSNGTNTPGNVIVSGQIPGNTYLIMIDGYEGDVCDILLTAGNAGVNGGVPDPPGVIHVDPPIESICLGAEICFMIDPVNDASDYEWEFPEDLATLTYSNANKICLEFDSIGVGIVSVRALNNCFPGVPSILPIQFSNENPTIRVCRSDLPIELNGELFYELGWHETTSSSNPICFGRERFQLIADTVFSSQKVSICKGEAAWIDTFSFSETGTYEIFFDGLSTGVCDSFIRLNLNVVDSIHHPHRTTHLSKLICPGDSVYVNNLPFYQDGMYSIVMENVSGTKCDSTVILDLKIPDTTAVSIECFPDTFLKAVTINWADRPLAEGYEFFINDSLVSTQNFKGYLYFPQASEEVLKIKIQPVGSHSCNYFPSEVTYVTPDFSTSNIYESFDLDVKINPNPSSGIFKIQSDSKIIMTETYDISGEKILISHSPEIDLSIQHPGIYFLKVKTENQTLIKKLIKL